MAVNVVTAPATMPVTVSEAKQILRIDHTADDASITMLIGNATAEAERLAWRAFVNRTVDLLLDGWPADGVIRLEYPPVSAITSITYYDENNVAATMPATDYIATLDVTPPTITLAKGASWPSATLRSISPIRVRYVCGYGAAAAVPDFYKHHILGLVAIYYENAEAMTGAASARLADIRTNLGSDRGWAT